MNIYNLKIPGLVICEPKIYQDDRGYFTETFRKDKLEQFLGHRVDFCQDNEAFSSYGVLRGLHYQLPPFAQSKLVRVITGKVLDVAVDIRRDSPTFGQHMAIVLSDENKRQLFIPKGFAHGYVVLSDEAKFAYKVDNLYDQSSERGIHFDDESLGIDWRVSRPHLQLSKKDLSQPPFALADHFEHSIKLYT